jgi:hypothetical protein
MDKHEDATTDAISNNGVPKSTKRWIDIARSTPPRDNKQRQGMTSLPTTARNSTSRARGLGRLGLDGKQCPYFAHRAIYPSS